MESVDSAMESADSIIRDFDATVRMKGRKREEELMRYAGISIFDGAPPTTRP
jgi:hypothetical protein